MSGKLRRHIGRCRLSLEGKTSLLSEILKEINENQSLDPDTLKEQMEELLNLRNSILKTYKKLNELHNDFQNLAKETEEERTIFEKFSMEHSYIPSMQKALEMIEDTDKMLDVLKKEGRLQGASLSSFENYSDKSQSSNPEREETPVSRNPDSRKASLSPVRRRSQSARRPSQARIISQSTEQQLSTNLSNQPTDTNLVMNKDAASIMLNAGITSRLKLPHFDGDIVKWPEFLDSFQSFIGRLNMEPTMKLTLLRSCLSGEALQMISGLQQINRNYEIAVLILKEEYEKPHLVTQTLMTQLHLLKPCGPDKRNLRAVYTKLNAIIQQLCPNGELESPDLLVNQIMTKLPLFLQSRIVKEQEYKKVEIFEVLRMIREIVEEERIEKILNTGSSTLISQSYPSSPPLMKSNEYMKRYQLCKGNHPVERCNMYTTPKDRDTAAYQMRLCKLSEQ